MNEQVSLVANELCVSYKSLRLVGGESTGPIKFRLLPKRSEKRAVRGVSFVARKGESIGVIGKNGSGKSTMLRAISGLEEIESGQVIARSVPLFLGVAPALLPDRTGVENIELGCLAMGLTKNQASRAVREVSELAGLGSAVWDPINTYSSGMRARLSFCISAAMAQTDILIVDEALSTGDAAFQERSREMMAKLLDRSGTIFLVSHSAKVIRENCDRVIWIHDGEVIADGQTSDVLDFYTQSVAASTRGLFARESAIYARMKKEYIAPKIEFR